MAAKVECPHYYNIPDETPSKCASSFEAPTKAEVLRLLIAHVRTAHPVKSKKKTRA